MIRKKELPQNSKRICFWGSSFFVSAYSLNYNVNQKNAIISIEGCGIILINCPIKEGCMMQDYVEQLIDAALSARELSYSPYSHFMVGAALLTKDNRIYTGCNIENAAYSPTNCAERTAFFKAVSEGNTEFKAIAIVGGPKDGELTWAYPCGVCRQVMAEFCNLNEFIVIAAKSREEYEIYSLDKLFPKSFGKSQLE